MDYSGYPKLRVTLKTPDALHRAAARAVLQSSLPDIGATEGEIEAIEERCRKWFQYGEVVTLEIDLEKHTCTVLEAT